MPGSEELIREAATGDTFYNNDTTMRILELLEERKKNLWAMQVFVAIDHFSRKVMSVCPLEGPNAGWICNALDAASIHHQ